MYQAWQLRGEMMLKAVTCRTINGLVIVILVCGKGSEATQSLSCTSLEQEKKIDGHLNATRESTVIWICDSVSCAGWHSPCSYTYNCIRSRREKQSHVSVAVLNPPICNDRWRRTFGLLETSEMLIILRNASLLSPPEQGALPPPLGIEPNFVNLSKDSKNLLGIRRSHSGDRDILFHLFISPYFSIVPQGKRSGNKRF